MKEVIIDNCMTISDLPCFVGCTTFFIDTENVDVLVELKKYITSSNSVTLTYDTLFVIMEHVVGFLTTNLHVDDYFMEKHKQTLVSLEDSDLIKFINIPSIFVVDYLEIMPELNDEFTVTGLLNVLNSKKYTSEIFAYLLNNYSIDPTDKPDLLDILICSTVDDILAVLHLLDGNGRSNILDIVSSVLRYDFLKFDNLVSYINGNIPFDTRNLRRLSEFPHKEFNYNIDHIKLHILSLRQNDIIDYIELIDSAELLIPIQQIITDLKYEECDRVVISNIFDVQQRVNIDTNQYPEWLCTLMTFNQLLDVDDIPMLITLYENQLIYLDKPIIRLHFVKITGIQLIEPMAFTRTDVVPNNTQMEYYKKAQLIIDNDFTPSDIICSDLTYGNKKILLKQMDPTTRFSYILDNLGVGDEQTIALLGCKLPNEVVFNDGTLSDFFDGSKCQPLIIYVDKLETFYGGIFKNSFVCNQGNHKGFSNFTQLTTYIDTSYQIVLNTYSSLASCTELLSLLIDLGEFCNFWDQSTLYTKTKLCVLIIGLREQPKLNLLTNLYIKDIDTFFGLELQEEDERLVIDASI